MKKFYTDQERFEFCRKWKLSGDTKSKFAKDNKIPVSTLRDWIYAYNNINGKFINVNQVVEKDNGIIDKEDLSVNVLSEVEKKEKSSHFSRFDYSIVVIEYKKIKITTSLEQAEILLERIYDNVQE